MGFHREKAEARPTGDPAELGDVWLFVALAATQKAVLSYRCRKARDGEHRSAGARFTRPHREPSADHKRRLRALSKRG